MLNADLECSVHELESRLGVLSGALCAHDAPAIEAAARELQGALARAVDQLTEASRGGDGSVLRLRQRLALAGGQVAAQGESLARATAALDRAIDVLMPAAAPRVAYTAAGRAERDHRRGLIQA